MPLAQVSVCDGECTEVQTRRHVLFLNCEKFIESSSVVGVILGTVFSPPLPIFSGLSA